MGYNNALSYHFSLLFYRIIICLDIVVYDKSSAWYKEAIKSLKDSKKSLQIIIYEKMESSCPSSNNNSQKRVLIVPPSCASQGLPSSSTLPEIDPNERPVSVTEEEPSPPKKKSTSSSSLQLTESKQTDDGTVPDRFMNQSIPRPDGKDTSSSGNSFGSFGPFGQPITSLPSTRFPDFREPNMQQTQPILGNFSLAADFPAFSFSGSSNLAQSTSNPTAFRSHIINSAPMTRFPNFGSQPMAPTQPTVGNSPFGPGNPSNFSVFSFPSINHIQSSARKISSAAAPMIFSPFNPIIQVIVN